MGSEASRSKVTAEDLELIRSGYERWNDGDLEALAGVLGEDVVFHAPPGWPGQRAYEGREAVTRFLDEVARTIALRPVNVVRAEALGAEVLIELRVRTHGSQSGIDIEDLTIYHVARVEYGKVTRVRAYMDEDAAVHAAYTGEDPPGPPATRGQVTEEDVDAVRSGYERWNNGDIAGLADLFTEDIVYQNAPIWPGQRVYRGAAAVTSFLQNEVAKVIALRPVTVVRTEMIGDEILIELQARTRGFMSGLEMGDLTLFHLARVENGRVSRVRVYMTAAEALKAAETGEG